MVCSESLETIAVTAMITSVKSVYAWSNMLLDGWENVVKMVTSSAASFERTGDTGDSSNTFHLIDKKNTKSDIWKYVLCALS